jgi:heat shock protein HslJ
MKQPCRNAPQKSLIKFREFFSIPLKIFSFNYTKIQLLSILILIFAFSINSCKTSRKTTANKIEPVVDNSMNSSDWNGTYFGVLPCADCNGIKTKIVLNEDLTFNITAQYQGKSDSVFSEKGKFEWNDEGNAITLDNLNQQTYKVGENVLFHLDKNGNRISGDLSEKYILKKENVEIIGKYWKLISLNGKPVDSVNREPFIKFHDDFSVNGNSSCNSFNGKYELFDGNKIKFSPFAMTKMACINNTIEVKLMHVFNNTTSYSVSTNQLILMDEFDTSLAIFEFDFFN